MKQDEEEIRKLNENMEVVSEIKKNLASKRKEKEQNTKKTDENEIRKLSKNMEVVSETKKKKIHKGICHIENQWYGGFCFKCFQTWQKASLPI